MLRFVLGTALAAASLIAAPGAAQQDEFAPADPELSDTEILRWAAREVQRAEPAPPAPPPSYVTHAPPPEPRYITPVEESPALRILAEVLGGVLGASAAGGLGALVIWAADQGGAAPDGMFVAIASSGVLGALGISAGVTLGGELTAGRGNFGHAFLGQVVGAAAAVPLIVSALEHDELAGALAAAALVPLIGAVIGYEVGHAEGAPRASGPIAFVAPLPGGVSAGVAGRL